MKCPLCPNQLKDVDENSAYCNTYIDVGPSTRWGHYVKKRNFSYQNGVTTYDQFKHTAIVSPFIIAWFEIDQYLTVHIFGIDKSNWRIQRKVYEAFKVNQEEMLRLYRKFSNLKAFT